MSSRSGRWVLVEFVDGPADGRLTPIQASTVADLTNGVVELVNTSGGYRPLSVPEPAALLDRWADREQSAIARFDQGPPELYIQMLWNSDDGPPEAESDDGKGLAGRGQEAQAERFLQALVDGHEQQCQAIARRAMTAGTVAGLIDTMLAPAMVAIGERWSRGQVPVYAERRATAIVQQLLCEHRPGTPTNPRGHAVVAAVDGEWHALPTEMATAALREDGWRVEHLGAGVPAGDLLSGAMVDDTSLLVISATMEANRQKSIATAAALSKQGRHVLVGGPGQSIRRLQRMARSVERR